MSKAIELDLFGPPPPPPAPIPTRTEAPSGSLLESGPYRFYIVTIPGEILHRRLIDRETGEEVERGPWLNIYGLACRKNGLIPDPTDGLKSSSSDIPGGIK